MNRKAYKVLMLMGRLPWRSDVLKPRRITDEDKLKRDGWEVANSYLPWRGENWTLYYKIVDQKPRALPGFPPISDVWIDNKYNLHYRYVEFQAIHPRSSRAELYAYGNFVQGNFRPYLLRGRQMIKTDPHSPEDL